MHGVVFEAWSTFLDEVLPYGLSETTFAKAQKLNRSITDAIQENVESLNRGEYRGTIFAQSRLHTVRQAEILQRELESFIRTGPRDPVPDVDRVRDQMTYLADDVVAPKYGNIVFDMYQSVFNSEYALAARAGPATRKSVALTRRTGEALSTSAHDAVSYRSSVLRQYDTLIPRVLAQTPKRMQRFVTLYVQLFVEEPLEALILYLRRQHPGAVGAFHGLEDGPEEVPVPKAKRLRDSGSR
jgi:hypothetical protein